MIERKKLVGIDPSFYNMGVCIYDTEKKTVQMFTGDFFEAVSFINRTVKLSEVWAVVENPALDGAVFGAFQPVKGEILKVINEASVSNLRKRNSMADVERVFSIAAKHAQNVGECKAAAKLIISMFKKRQVPVIEIAPSKRDRADKPKRGLRMLSMPTKTNARQFSELTGYGGTSSEHSRDAGTLVIGRTIAWAEMMSMKEVARANTKIATIHGEILEVKNGKFVIKK